MAVVNIQELIDMTSFEVYDVNENSRKVNSRNVVIPHNSCFGSELETISKERVNNPMSGSDFLEIMEQYLVDRLGVVVFVNKCQDCDCPENYRDYTHETEGPFLLV